MPITETTVCARWRQPIEENSSTGDTQPRDTLADQLDDPSSAAAEWTRVDRLITDEAYWVPTVTDRFIDLVSKRVRNYEISPVWGLLADRATVR